MVWTRESGVLKRHRPSFRAGAWKRRAGSESTKQSVVGNSPGSPLNDWGTEVCCTSPQASRSTADRLGLPSQDPLAGLRKLLGAKTPSSWRRSVTLFPARLCFGGHLVACFGSQPFATNAETRRQSKATPSYCSRSPRHG